MCVCACVCVYVCFVFAGDMAPSMFRPKQWRPKWGPNREPRLNQDDLHMLLGQGLVTTRGCDGCDARTEATPSTRAAAVSDASV